jgi:hypothetical protein
VNALSGSVMKDETGGCLQNDNSSLFGDSSSAAHACIMNMKTWQDFKIRILYEASHCPLSDLVKTLELTILEWKEHLKEMPDTFDPAKNNQEQDNS